MAEAAPSRFPEYVTDGFHIYKWNDEYERLLNDGRLKPAEAPPPREEKKLTPREARKVEEIRQKALKNAEDTVKALKSSKLVDLDEVFGSEPKDANETSTDSN